MGSRTILRNKLATSECRVVRARGPAYLIQRLQTETQVRPALSAGKMHKTKIKIRSMGVEMPCLHRLKVIRSLTRAARSHSKQVKMKGRMTKYLKLKGLKVAWPHLKARSAEILITIKSGDRLPLYDQTELRTTAPLIYPVHYRYKPCYKVNGRSTWTILALLAARWERLPVGIYSLGGIKALTSEYDRVHLTC